MWSGKNIFLDRTILNTKDYKRYDADHRSIVYGRCTYKLHKEKSTH